MEIGPVETEVDRTKSRWVARVLEEFGKPRTTIRALFYYALGMERADYPICGGFVGEIRATRPYHESDGPKLEKWVGRARQFGYIPVDAVIDDVPGIQVFEAGRAGAGQPGSEDGGFGMGIPGAGLEKKGPCPPELWVNRSSLSPLLLPLCSEKGVTLVIVDERPVKEALEGLRRRCPGGARVLCLLDLSPEGVAFCRELAGMTGMTGHEGGCDGDVEPGRMHRGQEGGEDNEKAQIRVEHIGLTPAQVAGLGLPTIPAPRTGRDDRRRYREYLEPFGLDPKRMAELDALEVRHPGGLAGFVATLLEDRLGRNRY